MESCLPYTMYTLLFVACFATIRYVHYRTINVSKGLVYLMRNKGNYTQAYCTWLLGRHDVVLFKQNIKCFASYFGSFCVYTMQYIQIDLKRLTCHQLHRMEYCKNWSCQRGNLKYNQCPQFRKKDQMINLF